jgi:hypothetical protein
LISCMIFGLLAPVLLVSVFKNRGIEKLFSLQNKKLA